jgi:hypothetical protein
MIDYPDNYYEMTLSQKIAVVRKAITGTPEPEKPAWKPEAGKWAWAECTCGCGIIGICKILSSASGGMIRISRNEDIPQMVHQSFLRPLTLDDLKKEFGVSQ